MNTTAYLLYCSYEGCARSRYILAQTPSAVVDIMIEDGWTFPQGEQPDVLSTFGRRHCPTHSGDPYGPWKDEQPTWRAECLTCGEEYTGSKDECTEWEIDHRCEPDITIGPIKSKKRVTTK